MSLKGYVLLGDRMVAVERIHSVSWHADDCDGFIVRTTSNQEIDVPFADALFEFGRIVPAQPGFFLLSGVDDIQEDDTITDAVWKTPVVAWVFLRGSVYVVTVNGYEKNAAILCPGGSVEDMGTPYESIDQWFQDRKRAALDARLKRGNPGQPPTEGKR